VKFSLCKSWRHTGVRDVAARDPKLSRRVVIFTARLLYLQYPMIVKVAGFHSGSGRCRGLKKVLPLWGLGKNFPRLSGPPAIHYTDYGERHLLRHNFIRKENALGIQCKVWEIMSYKRKRFYKNNCDRIHPPRKSPC